jgi:protein-L-isoaspartate(D-aspartate) O-methyltransferase
MSRIAGRVHAIERHAVLTKAAARRVTALDYWNIEFKTGDGTKGWPEKAPFDAILVAASGPDVPAALRQQLAVGGRLVIPVGESQRHQTLRRILRRTGTDYEEEDLGAVTFVPLIGEQGWSEDA